MGNIIIDNLRFNIDMDKFTQFIKFLLCTLPDNIINLNTMNKPSKRTTFSLIIEFFKDSDRKSLLRIMYEVIYLFFIFGSFPRHYFARYLFKNGNTNFRDYFPTGFFNTKVKPFFNKKEVREVLENKLYFNFFYSQFNISLPKILMYNHRKMFVFGNQYMEVNSAPDFKMLLEKIFKQNPSYDSIFIKKTSWSFGGDRVHKLFLNQIATDPEMVNELYSEVIKTGYLFQETIIQHPDLDKLNPSCINTIRFDTFINSDGKIEIISAYIRMSIINYHLDNISSGGCQVGIDLETGKLKKNGHFAIRTNGFKLLTEHPVTKTVFENFSIPLFRQAKELVINTASFMPDLRLIGWDVAIGESEPILIEGNSNYDLQGNDLAYGGYRSNPIFRKVLKEINYL